MEIYLLAKDIFIPQIVFSDISILKIPVSGLDFFQTCGFRRIIKKIMVHHLKLKKAHISGLYFL